MKNIRIILISLIIPLFAISCDMSLDSKPYESKDGNDLSEKDSEALTIGVYAYLRNSDILRHFHYVGEYGGDNVSLSGSTTDALYDIYRYARRDDNARIKTLWEETYKLIIHANKNLDMIPEDGTHDYYIGENLYFRAYLYLNLVNTFGRPYGQRPAVNLGVPLKLTHSQKEFPPRASVKEVYDQIVLDLLTAIDMLTISEDKDESTNIKVKSAKNNNYVSKEVAQALLSRVYLYMGNWKEAKKMADAVIASGRYSLLQGELYSAYPTFVPENNSETIFAIRQIKDVDHKGSNAIGSMYAKINNVGWGEMYASDSYLKLLGLYSDDLRHNFIKGQEVKDAKLKFIYPVDNGTEYEYRSVGVTKSGDNYTFEAGSTFSGNVQIDTNSNGGKRYYGVTNTGVRYQGRIEREVEKRDVFPKYFIYKCSLQEGQAQLWSPVISRLAEIYLNRAEANYHLGNEQAALDDINMLRERAKIPVWTMDNLGGRKVIDLVYEERRLELAFEGHRKFDVFRTNKTLDRRYPGTHLRGGTNVTKRQIPATDLAIVEFFPQSEIDAYPIVLEQNP